MTHKEKTAEQLREFGEIMALAALVFAGLGIYKRATITALVLAFLITALVFLFLGFFRPEVLRPIEKKWMVFAEKLGTVVTCIVMLITFYLVLSPIGLLLRLFGKDVLKTKLEPERKSYWEPVDPAGSGSRHFLPY